MSLPPSRLLLAAVFGATVAATGPATPAAAETVMLHDAVALLPTADESRAGYDRDLFRHWVDSDRDGCSTRQEVLIAEAVDRPQVGPSCAISGGVWHSYYDNVTVTAASSLDIDHVVPLAEAWDSGAHSWTAARRQAYANDLDEPLALVAVTARSNRSKSDQDPAEWLPPYEGALCRYVFDWLTTKLRWGLAADQAERDTLAGLVTGCPNEELSYEPAATVTP